MTQERIIVIGAGLAGLAVAARLLATGREVSVLEAGARAGGQIETLREGALVVELGAEGFVARSQAVPALCALLGIEDALVDQLTTDTYSIDGDRLLLLPPGEAARRLGFQVPEEELGRGIRALSLGMGQLIDALVARVGNQRLQLNTPITGLSRAGTELVVAHAQGEEPAARVVLATPARLASTLLSALGLPQTTALAAAPLMSNVSVNLLYREGQFSDYPSGSGVLFPDSFAPRGLRALSLVNHKFAGRSARGDALVRVFFRPVGDALRTWPDQRYADEAASAIGEILRVDGAPQRAWVSRWADALPVFSPAYKAQAAAADIALQALGVHVTGSAFHGAGIDAAVKSAEAVAARLIV